MLLSNQELICTIFFNKTFPVKFCWHTKMIGSEIPMSFFPGDRASFCEAAFATNSPYKVLKCWQLTADDTVWQACHMLTQEIVFLALSALERLWLQGQRDGAESGAQGIPVLLYRTPGFSPLTFHFKLTSSTSRARGYKLRLPDWTWLWKEGACGIFAPCICSRKGGTRQSASL